MKRIGANNVAHRVNKSQRFFKRSTLYFYDPVVFGMVTRHLWKCPVPTLIGHYHRFVTANHLDVGVGTGYLLDHCPFPKPNPRLHLMDLSEGCLEISKRRLSRYKPVIHVQNILEPIQLDVQKFDSIGINYVMHCVPGYFNEKGVAFSSLKGLLTDEGVLFGSTLLSGGINQGAWPKLFMNVLNLAGLFNNSADTPDALSESLQASFNHVQVEIAGSAALFAASDRAL